MNKLLAFGASSSKNSRNKKLASYVANRMAPKEAILVDLNEFEMPISVSYTHLTLPTKA